MSTATSSAAPETAVQKSKGKKALKIIIIISAVIAAIAAVTAAANAFLRSSQLKFAASFEPVAYGSDRLTPEKDENGCWTFTTGGRSAKYS